MSNLSSGTSAMLRKASLGTLPEITTNVVITHGKLPNTMTFRLLPKCALIISPQRCSVTPPLEWTFQWDLKSVLKTVEIKTGSTAFFDKNFVSTLNSIFVL